jgi:hypothetical protein
MRTLFTNQVSMSKHLESPSFWVIKPTFPNSVKKNEVESRSGSEIEEENYIYQARAIATETTKFRLNCQHGG